MNELNLVFAFTAGLVATVNPCGWAMLPSFVSYYLGSEEDDYEQRSIIIRIREGFVLGLLVTTGFMTIFGIVGFVISAGLRALIQWMPLAGVLVGGFLVFLGVWVLTGKSLPIITATPDLNLNVRNPKTAFLFGVAYASASLSCTLPVFLAVVGAGLAAAGSGTMALMFIIYGAGMAVVLMTVALMAVFLKGTAVQRFNRFLPNINRISAGLLIIAGLYLIWYQGRYLPLILAGL